MSGDDAGVKGYWINERQWQCPACGHINNGERNDNCDHCERGARPAEEESISEMSDETGTVTVEAAMTIWHRFLPTSKWVGLTTTHLRGRVKVFTRHGTVLLRVENIAGSAGLTPDEAEELAGDLQMFARLAREEQDSLG